jgi:hypothetical protein
MLAFPNVADEDGGFHMRGLFNTQAAAIALAGSLALSFGCSAQQVTDAQRDACMPDAFRLCSAEIPDSGRVAACMDAHVNSLSPACRAAFQWQGASAEVTHHRHRHYARRLSGDEALVRN